MHAMNTIDSTTLSPNVVSVVPLGFPWQTIDPFLFCVHYDDAYPAGNAQMGPATPLSGRNRCQDFSRKDRWSMYHGATVPGFPTHPHRGFKTVTIVRQVYLFKGAGVRMAGQGVPPSCAVQVQAHHPLELENGSEVSEMLVL
jgi:hypothetical protein